LLGGVLFTAGWIGFATVTFFLDRANMELGLGSRWARRALPRYLLEGCKFLRNQPFLFDPRQEFWRIAAFLVAVHNKVGYYLAAPGIPRPLIPGSL